MDGEDRIAAQINTNAPFTIEDEGEKIYVLDRPIYE